MNSSLQPAKSPTLRRCVASDRVRYRRSTNSLNFGALRWRMRSAGVRIMTQATAEAARTVAETG